LCTSTRGEGRNFREGAKPPLLPALPQKEKYQGRVKERLRFSYTTISPSLVREGDKGGRLLTNI